MNQYVTGTTIKALRERNKMTQLQLAEKIGVSDKTVWKRLSGYYASGADCSSILRIDYGIAVGGYRDEFECISEYAAFSFLRMSGVRKHRSQYGGSGDSVPRRKAGAGGSGRDR